MNNIYEILRKHFSGEASPDDNKTAGSFKKNNPLEYQMLYFLWWSKILISVKDFDTQAAWQKILNRVEQRRARVIPLYGKLTRIAAVAAILIVVTFALYQVNEKVFRDNVVITTSQNYHDKEITLSDGSKVWLNDSTKFSYPKEFKGEIRKVSLEGEAYFEIAKNPDMPFIIETTHSEIKVLGTSFNVNTNKHETNVAVVTGKVNVKSLYNETSVTLEPDFMAVVSSDKIQKSGITNPNFSSWKTGRFEFNNVQLTQVAHDLNSFYDKKIVVKKSNTNCNFTANFDNNELSEILEVLAFTCNIQITEKENSYEIW